MRMLSLSSCCCHGPLSFRLWVACHLPVRWGQSSGARPSGTLCSNAWEFGAGQCVGPGCVFHVLLALEKGPDRGCPAPSTVPAPTCRLLSPNALSLL